MTLWFAIQNWFFISKLFPHSLSLFFSFAFLLHYHLYCMSKEEKLFMLFLSSFSFFLYFIIFSIPFLIVRNLNFSSSSLFYGNRLLKKVWRRHMRLMWSSVIEFVCKFWEFYSRFCSEFEGGMCFSPEKNYAKHSNLRWCMFRYLNILQNISLWLKTERKCYKCRKNIYEPA